MIDPAVLRGVVALLEDLSTPIDLRLRHALLILRPLVEAPPVSKDALRMREKRAFERAANAGERAGPEAPRTDVRTRANAGGVGGAVSSDPRSPDSLSDSAALQHPEREGKPGEQAVRTRANTMTLGADLTGELRQIAGMTTVQDLEGAWLKFKGHYNGRSWTATELEGAWLKWCTREAKDERTDRDRAARRGGGPVRADEDRPAVRRAPETLHPIDEERIRAAGRKA